MDIYKYCHMFLHCNIQCCIHPSLMYHCMLQDHDTDRLDKCHMEHSLGSIMTAVDSVCLLRKLLYNCSIESSHLGYKCHMLLVWLYNLTHKERLVFSYRGIIVIIIVYLLFDLCLECICQFQIFPVIFINSNIYLSKYSAFLKYIEKLINKKTRILSGQIRLFEGERLYCTSGYSIVQACLMSTCLKYQEKKFVFK